MGSRGREVKKTLRGTKVSDGKALVGKGRLTDKAINTLQNHYGMAIRQNSDSLYAMKKSVVAILHHCSDISDNEKRHRYCPRT